VAEEEHPAPATSASPPRKRARPGTSPVRAEPAGQAEAPAEPVTMAAAKPASNSRSRTSRKPAGAGSGQKPGTGAGRGQKPAAGPGREQEPGVAPGRGGKLAAGAGGERQSGAGTAKPARRPPKPPRTSHARVKTAQGSPAGVGGEIAGYQIEEQIGAGGMAVVYRARDERLGRPVALKVLAPGLASDTDFRNRFIRESRAAAAVDHPNIIPIYEAGDAGGVLFIAMRFVQGGDVGSLLAQPGPLAAQRVWDIISQVADALDAAHGRGLIHRDVKPANMLLDVPAAASGAAAGSPAPARREHVYLSDFGISKQSLSAKTLTATGQFVGTLDYIAPEQIEGRGVDGRADLYSLGCAAFELLSGEPPFRRGRGLALIGAHLSEPPPPVTAQRPDLPAAVDAVLAAAMAKSPDERYDTCAEFATHLGRALGLLPAGEPQPPGGAQHPPTVSVPQRAAAPAPASPIPAPAPPVPGPPVPAPQVPAAVPAASPAADAGQAVPAGVAWPTGPYGPYGAYPPAGPPPARRRRSRGLRIGLLSLAVAVALAAGAAVAVLVVNHGRVIASPPSTPAPATGSPTISPPSPSPRAEAVAVSNLLATGANSSTVLTYAADNVQSCTRLSHSVRQIQQVRDQRQAEYEQAQKLSTGALANGSEIKADLFQSLLDSLTADNDYLSWAQQQAASCQPGSQSAAALAADQQAVRDKSRFVQLWNVTAAQYGLAPVTVSGI
jgi:serine/threonine protein kinase